jgi:hypothetical protein
VTARGHAARVVAAALLATTALAAVPASGAACPARRTTGRWTAYDLPETQTNEVAVSFSPDPRLPDTLFTLGYLPIVPMTAGGYERDIMRSDDGGCTWARVYSLSTLPATNRLSTTGRFTSLVVAPRTAKTPAAVYALVVDNGGSLTVATPSMTVVSTDGGHQWKAYEPAPADSTKDVPRCTWGDIYPGVTARTAYLYCSNSALGEIGNVAKCASSYYATTDAGATWRPVAPGVVDPGRVGPPADPAKDSVSTGCGPAAQRSATQPDTATPNVLWDVAAGPDSDTVVLARSPDGGRTWRPWVAMPWASAFQVLVSTPRGRTPVAVGRGSAARLGWSVGGGPFRDAPPILVPAQEKGAITSVGLVPGGDLLVATYFDGRNVARVFTYDVRRGHGWVERQRPPANGKTPPWDGYGGTMFVAHESSPYVYISLPSGHRVLRLDTRGSR